MSASTRIPTWALLFGVLVLAAIYSEATAAPKPDGDGRHTWREQALLWLVEGGSDERFAYHETLITGR